MTAPGLAIEQLTKYLLSYVNCNKWTPFACMPLITDIVSSDLRDQTCIEGVSPSSPDAIIEPSIVLTAILITSDV